MSLTPDDAAPGRPSPDHPTQQSYALIYIGNPVTSVERDDAGGCVGASSNDAIDRYNS
jgi:hypothetical protein